MLLSLLLTATMFVASMVYYPEVWLAWIQRSRAWLAEREEQRLAKLRTEFYDYTQNLSQDLEAFGWERVRIDRLIASLRDAYEKSPAE